MKKGLETDCFRKDFLSMGHGWILLSDIWQIKVWIISYFFACAWCNLTVDVWFWTARVKGTLSENFIQFQSMTFEITKCHCQLFVYKNGKLLCFSSDFTKTLWDCSTHNFHQKSHFGHEVLHLFSWVSFALQFFAYAIIIHFEWNL